MSFAETIAVIRDIAFLVLLIVATLAIVLLFLKASAVLGSAKRTFKDAEDVVSTVTGRIMGPAMASSGAAFGVGKALAFVLGLRRKRQRGKNDGK